MKPPMFYHLMSLLEHGLLKDEAVDFKPHMMQPYPSQKANKFSRVVELLLHITIRSERQRSPGELLRQELSAHSRGWYVPQSRTIMHNANDSLR